MSIKTKVRNTSIWLQMHPSLGVSIMDYLYSKFDGMYPGKWRSAHPNQTSVQNWRNTWAEAFDEEHITPGQVKAGIDQCRKLFDWPPSLTEFLKACTNSVPHMHRNFQQTISHRMTKEERLAGLRKIREISKILH